MMLFRLHAAAFTAVQSIGGKGFNAGGRIRMVSWEMEPSLRGRTHPLPWTLEDSLPSRFRLVQNTHVLSSATTM